MSNQKQFSGRDAFFRMSYLHQIADICRQKPGDDYCKLMLHYGSQLVSIGKKSQCRMSPYMKRTICKGCNCILSPGDTSKIQYIKRKRQPDILIDECKLCGSKKSFPLRKGYELWCDKADAIVNIINTDPDQTSDDNNPKVNANLNNSSEHHLAQCLTRPGSESLSIENETEKMSLK